MSLFSLMNDKQKIFLLVGVCSLAIFVATAFYFSEGSFDLTGFWSIFGRPNDSTNWLGFIAIGNIFASLVGWFIFKDK